MMESHISRDCHVSQFCHQNSSKIHIENEQLRCLLTRTQVLVFHFLTTPSLKHTAESAGECSWGI
jgi:hypothetical protein